MKYVALLFLILFSCVAVVLGQTWAQRARVKDHTVFFMAVVQETVYELERRGFSNLKMVDEKQDISDQLYRLNINGTALYTNGFLVSMQHIDVTAMSQSVNAPSINDISMPNAVVRGTMNFRDLKLGYDVLFTPVDGPVQRYTGDILQSLIPWTIVIQKDMTTSEITLHLQVNPSSGGSGLKMAYRPENSVTQALSRHFGPLNVRSGITSWLPYLTEIIAEVIKNKVPFPDICFNHC